jgi:hypothetical protein
MWMPVENRYANFGICVPVSRNLVGGSNALFLDVIASA